MKVPIEIYDLILEYAYVNCCECKSKVSYKKLDKCIWIKNEMSFLSKFKIHYFCSEKCMNKYLDEN
tara:strand:- start:901 stop:1098 length:198 start_codon:yes stop_codon:yes gene_type:complete